jgi:hypothetical protein
MTNHKRMDSEKTAIAEFTCADEVTPEPDKAVR